MNFLIWYLSPCVWTKFLLDCGSSELGRSFGGVAKKNTYTNFLNFCYVPKGLNLHNMLVILMRPTTFDYSNDLQYKQCIAGSPYMFRKRIKRSGFQTNSVEKNEQNHQLPFLVLEHVWQRFLCEKHLMKGMKSMLNGLSASAIVRDEHCFNNSPSPRNLILQIINLVQFGL